MADTDRDVLFANESFLIGMLEAVSGGALIAALAQSEAFVTWLGKWPFLAFLTSMALALLLAVLAAYWKHQYKLWDVKAQASAARNENAEANKRSERAQCYLKLMRVAILASVVGIGLGLGTMIVAFWCTQWQGRAPMIQTVPPVSQPGSPVSQPEAPVSQPVTPVPEPEAPLG